MGRARDAGREDPRPLDPFPHEAPAAPLEVDVVDVAPERAGILRWALEPTYCSFVGSI
jgi:hypothetical protein